MEESEGSNGGFAKYSDKINCFVGCLKREEWIAVADAATIDAILGAAVDIERTLAREEARKLRGVLDAEYPEHDLTRSADLVLEALIPSRANEDAVLRAIDKYREGHEKKELRDILRRLLETKVTKERLMSVIGKLGNENVGKRLEARLIAHLWGEMIPNDGDNFEDSFDDIFSRDAALLLSYLSILRESTDLPTLSAVLKRLNGRSNSKLWFDLLSDKNREMTLSTCSLYPDFLEGLLEFLRKYASEACCQEGEMQQQQQQQQQQWSHDGLPLSNFVDIINFFLANDGKVGAAVGEFIDSEINNFGESFPFWLHIKTLLS